jgi:hypothetical protein
VSALGDKNVRGLDVAVDDAFSTGRIERVNHFDGHAENFLQVRGAEIKCFSVVPSRNSMDKSARVLLADVVDRTDIRVLESRRYLCFALKASQRLRIVGDGIRKKLQGDRTVKASVFRFITTPMPPPPSFSRMR